ncbi:MAG: glycerol-3-phosphate dehydrogenase/oxidase [Terriglobales bacterium]
MTLRSSLDGERFDVLVIGGGINGVAIARECARAGRRTLLVEQLDFAAGTTSRSTRIIHGGLRYLEHGDLAQVRESLRERQRLVRERPQLVRPLEFLLALDGHSRRSALAVHAGLWFYRKLGGAVRGGSPQSQQNALERLLDAGRHFSVFSFQDAQCEFPERLVAEWLTEMIAAGGTARNHTKVLAVELRDGRAVAVRLRDSMSGAEERVEATWTINATGPWADQICQSSGISTGHPMVGGVRGSHIVLPKFAGAPEAAVYTEAVDGRPIFIIPWNDQILVGTTEVPDTNDPAQVRPSDDELEYLWRSFQQLFPGIRIARNEVHYAFAGVRPLPYSPQAQPLAISRRHYFHDHAADGAQGMISVIGGKLTTAASLARECVAKIGTAVSEPVTLAMVSGDEVRTAFERAISEVAQRGEISRKAAHAMVEWHGEKALAIAAMARGRAEFQAPLCPHTDHIVAEAVHAVDHECAVTLADVLLRRVPVALGACWSQECSRQAAHRIASATGWDENRVGQELEGLDLERESFLQRPR